MWILSFSDFLVFNVLCLEFGLQKARVDRFFKDNFPFTKPFTIQFVKKTLLLLII